MASANTRLTKPPGKIPQLISLNPKIASSAAIAKSQAMSGVNAPPKQKPLTMAMVGLGKVKSRRQRHSCDAQLALRLSSGLLSVPRKYSRRSCPAHQADPAPVITNTLVSLSTSSSVSASSLSQCICGFMAFRFSGRFKIHQVIPSSFSTFTVLNSFVSTFLYLLADFCRAYSSLKGIVKGLDCRYTLAKSILLDHLFL